MAFEGNSLKSFRSGDPLTKYCTDVSIKLHESQVRLQEKTLAEAGGHAAMLGAPEVLQFGSNLIQAIGGKRALDIGTFTGASALAWALAVPDGGQVITFDVDDASFKQIGKPIFQQIPQIANKITFKLGAALDFLDELIKNGETGKFDFAFIDADKVNYSNYYERCLTLLRPGGIILVDNALWNGRVVLDEKDSRTEAIDQLNRFAHQDPRVNNTLLNLGDGAHVIFKK